MIKLPSKLLMEAAVHVMNPFMAAAQMESIVNNSEKINVVDLKNLAAVMMIITKPNNMQKITVKEITDVNIHSLVVVQDQL